MTMRCTERASVRGIARLPDFGALEEALEGDWPGRVSQLEAV
jgi:hypothetical protein